MSTKVIYRRAEVFVLACMKSVFREVRLQANLGLMFERKAKISCNSGQSVIKNLRARQDCRWTSRKTDFRQKNETSAGLKITCSIQEYIKKTAYKNSIQECVYFTSVSVKVVDIYLAALRLGKYPLLFTRLQ